MKNKPMKGAWEVMAKNPFTGKYDLEFWVSCSECGYITDKPTNYCPRCGTSMG